MIRKVLLLFRTVKYLKIKQIIYQLYYRVKPQKTLSHYRNSVPQSMGFQTLSFTNSFAVAGIVEGNSTFTFLNLKHDFPSVVDWDFQGFGKLWNYNLQYFNFLHQQDVADTQKQVWLKDIGHWLLDGRLKLEPYPVSLRSLNCIRYFSEHHVQDRELIHQTYAELSYLEQNLEFHILGNHLLENAFALMMGACTFQHEAWKAKAKKLLKEELEEQILDDGAHFELSPMYHQIILFRVLELADWYSKTEDKDDVFLDFIKQKASQMLGWLKAITFKNGDIPHFNDSAIGIAFNSEELFQFAHNLGLQFGSAANLGESGYRKLSSENYECAIDVGPVGPSYQPGHSHSDALSFILYANNAPFLVEAGTSTYQIGEKRDFERSTAAHNTVVIGGLNQSEVWGGFRVADRANVEIIKESRSSLVAQCDGYQKRFSAIHQRSFTFEKQLILIRDEIFSKKALIGNAYFHFHPDCIIDIKKDGTVHIRNTGTIKLINSASYVIEDYEFSNGYNQYRTGQVLIVGFQGWLETQIETGEYSDEVPAE